MEHAKMTFYYQQIVHLTRNAYEDISLLEK